MNVDWLTDLETKGFVKFFRPDIADLIEVDSFNLVHTEEMLRDNYAEDLPAHINKQLNLVSTILKTEYIDPAFGEKNNKFLKYVLWEGVDADSALWHNDGFEGMNYFFLLYFDNMKPETGGAVYFKYDNNEVQIYPQRGDLILLNQKNPKFFHRAEKAKITRRQASFDFLVY